MSLKILSVSSSRADLSALGPVWSGLAAVPGVELHVMLTGMHRGEGGDRAAALAVIPESATRHEAGASIGGADARMCARAMADILRETGDILAEVAPDVVLLMGDRLDMIPAAIAAVPFNVPVAHLHGGELTFGAVDDRLRHAMSKLAHIHLVSGVDAAKRLARMGESPDRIHVTGAPGLDALSGAPEMSRAELLSELGLEDGLVRLVTVHPETNAQDPLAPAAVVLSALDQMPGPTIITAANADMGGAEINRRIAEFAKTRPWVIFRDTLGTKLYANALRHAAVIVGNSSSGLVEAGLFGLHVINVGHRQDGRARGLNVRDVPADAERIAGALAAVTCLRYDPAEASIYGDARSAPRVASVLARPHDRGRLLAKGFHEGEANFVAPWAKEADGTVSAGTGKLPKDLLILVPARGGSKRLPGKNLKSLGGRSLLAWTDRAIRAAGLDGHPCLLTTEDESIAEEGRRLGWRVPWLRPAELASDAATTLDVAIHALDWWQQTHGADPEILLLLQVTSPFRDGGDLRTGLDLIVSDPGLDAVFSAAEIHRTEATLFREVGGGRLRPIGQTADRGPLFTPNGSFYAIRPRALRSQETFFPGNCRAVVMDAVRSLDIDTPADFAVAQAMAASGEAGGQTQVNA